MTTTGPHVLSYATPARSWTDALPIGNGCLGAMVFGPGPDRHDQWQVNDDTCWSGWPGSAAGVAASDEPSPGVVNRVRTALLAGDVGTAETEIRKVQYGHSQAYQPLAELELRVDADTTVVQRRLDLVTATAEWVGSGRTGAAAGEVFASAPAQALVGRYGWEQPTDLRLVLTAAHASYGHATVRADADAHRIVLVSRMPTDVAPHHDGTDDAVVYDLALGRAVTAVLVTRVVTDGTVRSDPDHGDGGLTITGARELLVVVTTETDFVDAVTTPHGDVDVLVAQATTRADQVASRSFDDLRLEHTVEHRSWFDRFELQLGDDSANLDQPADQPAADTPGDTDALLAGDVAPELAALMVSYSRYLTIAASRPGTRAINLQGIWNPWVQPPWSSNYTVNINTEMNYWPALVTNLAECVQPLHALVETMAGNGGDTARRVFDRPGWAAHHNTDVWGYTLPVGTGRANPCWAAWPMAGFWLLRHLWEHYAFTGDVDQLLQRGWPLIDGAVEFGLATLITLPDGDLGVAPSTSPENSYLTADGERAAVAVSATMDLALLRDVFAIWQRTADLVRARGGQVDPARAEAVAATLPRLPLPRPTARGTYPEWRDDLTEAEPTHRHQSHLYDVYPGDAVTAYDPGSAALLAAASETLRLRGAYSTGWSLAWRIALHARLRDRDAVMVSLGYYLSPVTEDPDNAEGRGFAQAGGVYRNLFCAHPPFQIDGNFGAAAGVIEMLVQSHGTQGDRRIIELLPCLPAAWPVGRMTGVRARGGLTLDLAWADGAPTSVTVRADHDQAIVLRVPGHDDRAVDLVAGEIWVAVP